MNRKICIILIMFFLGIRAVTPQQKNLIVVDHNGGGDFRTITKAINNLPLFNYQRVMIYIKKGIYTEKIRIEQDYITLKGESRDNTILQYNQLRDAWVKNQDAIGPAVVNVHADNIIIDNLTIKNTHPEIGPHAFAVYGDGTRTIIMNCKVISKGADTVSLWDYKTGMYYHANCYFEGAVDFVCPRGWCYIKDSQFFEVKKTAAIWHAGGYDPDQKFVVVNSSFDGVKDFYLARHHYEAQFYLLNCHFSENMGDSPIYRVVYEDSTRNRPFNWGKRYYFYHCQREGGDYEWFKDDLNNALKCEDITPAWTFDGKWDPETNTGPKIIKYEIHEDVVLLYFTESLTVTGRPVLKSKTGEFLIYDNGAGSDTMRFKTNKHIIKTDLVGLTICNDAKITGTIASIHDRCADLTILP